MYSQGPCGILAEKREQLTSDAKSGFLTALVSVSYSRCLRWENFPFLLQKKGGVHIYHAEIPQPGWTLDKRCSGSLTIRSPE